LFVLFRKFIGRVNNASGIAALSRVCECIDNVDGMIDSGGWVEAKERGLVKNVGKEYIVKDGDYMIVLSNK